MIAKANEGKKFDKDVATESKAEKGKTILITLDNTKLKILLDVDSLKSLEKSKHVLKDSLTKKRLDKDSVYFSIDSAYRITIKPTGAIKSIVSLEEYNTKGVNNPPPPPPQIKEKNTETQVKEEEENKEPESNDDKEEAYEDEQ